MSIVMIRGYGLPEAEIVDGGQGATRVTAFSVSRYLDLKEQLAEMGFRGDVDWAEVVGPPQGATSFWIEYTFVVCNSGMKAEVARGIFNRIRSAIARGELVSSVFRHPGKASAIQYVYEERLRWYRDYQMAGDKLAFLESMPWIGPITKYHLAKNFGLDVVKPDRHLVRIADAHGSDPHTLCEEIAQVTGDRIGTVDVVLWRAAALGIHDTAVAT